MPQNYLVYQAYNSKDILHEALYSILSFYKVQGLDHRETKVVVYTDNKSFFENTLGKERVECRSVHPDVIKTWRGEIDFVHRVKIEMLIDFTKEIQEGNILYLDSDTYFLQPVSELFESMNKGDFLMHEYEGKFNDSEFYLIRKMGKYIRKHKAVFQAEGLLIPDDASVWNAGLIGFNAKYKEVLHRVLSFTDRFYKVYPKHIAEQFAFSFHLSQEGKVSVAREAVFHYWNFKEFRTVLNDFFTYHASSDVEKIVAELDLISPVLLGEPKREYETMHWLPKAFRKLKKNRWNMPDYKYRTPR